MSEVENETNPIEDLVQAALEKNYTAATEIFNDAVGQKMTSALDQEQIRIANQIYNGGAPEEDDYEVSDEIDQQDDADYEDNEEELDLEIDDEDLEIDEDDEVEN
jgi:hypothetical protein